MVAHGQADPLAWHTHRSGDRGHVLDQAIQLAADRCGPGCDYCEAATGESTKTENGPGCIWSAYSLRFNSDWELDHLDKISILRSHRIGCQNHIASLNNETLLKLVASSNLYAARYLRFL